MNIESEVEEKSIEAKPKASLAGIALIAALAGFGINEGVDVATADAQANKIVAEYVKDKAVEYSEKTKGDTATIVNGKKIVTPAEVDFRPNIIIDSTMIFELTVKDLVSGKVWEKGIIRANDSTGRLHVFARIQPCTKDILNADTIPDIKE